MIKLLIKISIYYTNWLSNYFLYRLMKATLKNTYNHMSCHSIFTISVKSGGVSLHDIIRKQISVEGW